jgi:lipopolysaccharide/colanic/teichoic acid biosynthesis glycosyltransferase
MNLQESMTGFYYVGTKRANITKLVNMYKRGYASGNLNQAMAELTRRDHILPEVICCEASLGIEMIRQWAKFISTQERLAGIPFIIDGDLKRPMENDQFVRSQMVDEILNIKEQDEQSLLAKINFLKKYKARLAELKKQDPEVQDVNVSGSLQFFLRRSLDLVVSLIALIFLTPVFLLIGLAIRLESKGPVFYISRRAGMGYRIFNFYKFRTMFPDAEKRLEEFAHLNQYRDSELARFYKLKDDPRITRVGRFLRNSSLDELPQLINVLLGDMSLVGNRPLPLYEAEHLTTDKLAKRFLAPAGITGLWQVQKRSHPDMSESERIGLDIDYADKSNLLFDMWIIAHTPQALIQRHNT